MPARFLPSGRSILVGLALLALACGAYVAARQTSTFAVAHIEIAGGSPDIRRQVRRELAPLVGTSLLSLDGSSLERRVESLPSVVSVAYDRAFPHTLRLTIVPETSVAVLHRGTQTWLLSGRGRVVVSIVPGTYPALPRVWVPRATMTHRELVLRLRSGLELRLGDPTDVRLKLAVARRALRGLPAGTAYLDVSVPDRPVAGINPRVSGRG